MSEGMQQVTSGGVYLGGGQSATLGRWLRPVDVARTRCETLGCAAQATVTVRWRQDGGARGGEWFHCADCAARILYRVGVVPVAEVER